MFPQKVEHRVTLWTFQVAETVKNPPVMWETQVQYLGWKDPLEKGMAIHSSILGEFQGERSLVATVHGVAKTWTQLSN